jgi:hypothetical protein
MLPKDSSDSVEHQFFNEEDVYVKENYPFLVTKAIAKFDILTAIKIWSRKNHIKLAIGCRIQIGSTHYVSWARFPNTYLGRIFALGPDMHFRFKTADHALLFKLTF